MEGSLFPVFNPTENLKLLNQFVSVPVHMERKRKRNKKRIFNWFCFLFPGTKFFSFFRQSRFYPGLGIADGEHSKVYSCPKILNMHRPHAGLVKQHEVRLDGTFRVTFSTMYIVPICSQRGYKA